MAIGIFVGKDLEEHKGYHWFIEAFKKSLLKLDPKLTFEVWPDIKSPEEIDCALAWRAAPNVFKDLPNLKAIFSMAAGVDHLVNEPTVPKQIPIARVKDPTMARDMTHYAITMVMNVMRRTFHWQQEQEKSIWRKQPPFTYVDEKTVGVMGLGYLGAKIAKTLAEIDLKVMGWSRSQKNIENVKCYAGKEELKDFLNQVDILICMLPVTSETENLLNKDLFNQLKDQAYLINMARGEMVVDQDLLDALDNDMLSGACLDVFRTEPLPEDSPFWQHPKILVTPHVAAVTNPYTASQQIYENIVRLQKGELLHNLVDRQRGY